MSFITNNWKPSGPRYSALEEKVLRSRKTIKESFVDRILIGEDAAQTFDVAPSGEKKHIEGKKTDLPPFFLLPHDFTRRSVITPYTSYLHPTYFGNLSPFKKPEHPPYFLVESLKEKWEEFPQGDIWTRKAQLFLKTKGQLRIADNGYVYLKISDDWVDKLFFLFAPLGAEKPFNPYLMNALGAHIGVITPQEFQRKSLSGKIHEVGKHYIFELLSLSVLTRPEGELETAWVFVISSPALAELRESYGLSKMPTEKGFILPLAYKKRSRIQETISSKSTFFRISPGSTPA